MGSLVRYFSFLFVLDMCEIDHHSYSSVFSLLQEPVLFGTSVMENIRFGKPSATDAEVKTAAKQANAHNFITGFPDGYNTVVGKRC